MEQLQSIKSENVVKKIFGYMVENGYRNANIENLSKAAGVSESVLSETFGKKEDICVAALRFGFEMVINKIFDFINFKLDYRIFFDDIINAVARNKAELRLICCAASSVEYGKEMKLCSSDLAPLYKELAARAAERYGCSVEDMEPVLRMFISIIHDYIVWDDIDVVEMQIEYIYSIMIRKLGYEFG